MGKIAGGLIGITRNDSVRNKWSLTYNERASLAEDAKNMFGLTHENDDDDATSKDCLPSRRNRDENDVRKLVDQFERFQIFSDANPSELISLTTGDVASEEIKDDMTNAFINGKRRVSEFVNERLMCKTRDFPATLTKQNSKTFETLYARSQRTAKETSTLKSDRDLLRRILISIEAGRVVDMDSMLQRELYCIPLSLARTDSQLRPTDKSLLAAILQDGATATEIPDSTLKTCTIIDAMALVRAIGKPPGAVTFGDLADIVGKCVTSYFSENNTRIDLVFDQYSANSIKTGKRLQRSKTQRKIRTVIHNRQTKLPTVWNTFIDLAENKSSLSSFLCNELEQLSLPAGYELILSGGFEDSEHVTSNIRGDITALYACHEEADTRIILHAANANQEGYTRLIISCRDTDVLVMLIVFASNLSDEIWMKSGTVKKPCYVRYVIETQIQRGLLQSQVAIPRASLWGFRRSHLGKFLYNTQVFSENLEILSSPILL